MKRVMVLLMTSMVLPMVVKMIHGNLLVSADASENLIAIGTKRRYLWGQSNYLFRHDTNLIFEAPEIPGWTFDHIEVDFGCEVGGVTGSNVSSIFTIDNGYIRECRPG